MLLKNWLQATLKKIFISGFIILSVSAGSRTSFAAVSEKNQPEASAASSLNTTTLPEVVVSGNAKTQKTAKGATGTKTNTPLVDIPASIQVVPQNLVETQAGSSSNVDYAIRNVSGVVQSSSSNYGFFNNYLIRGLNMNFLRDGVPDATTTNGYSRSLSDVESTEVLKGPGSALYGSGSPGGSINLISKEPLSEPAYSAAGSFGSFQTYETTGDMTGPIVPGKLDYRLIGSYFNSDGYRDVGRETFELLPTFKIHFSDTHSMTLDFDYRDIQVVSDTNGIPFQGTSLTQRNSLLDVSRDKKYYTPFAHTDQKVYRYAVKDEWQMSDSFLLRNNAVILDRDLFILRNGGGTVAAGSRVMTGRSLREQIDNVTDYLYQLESVYDFNTWDIAHKLLTGFEYQYHDVTAKRSTAALQNITNVFDPVIPEQSRDNLNFVPNFNRDINANYQSVYAQDQIDLTEKLKARFGGRLDRFMTHVNSRLDAIRERREDHPFSWQAGLLYQWIQQNAFYGGIASSKQAILTTESSAPLNKPEGALQYEIGNKSNFFDEKLTFDASWFYVKRKDFLVTVGTDTLPVGEQRTQGVEFDAGIKPFSGWDIHANYSFQNAALINVPQITGSPSVNGNKPVGIPSNLFNFWTTYEFQKGMLRGFGVGGGFTYRDSSFQNLQNTNVIPSYITMDAVIFYRQKWYDIQVNARNLNNAVYYRSGVNSGLYPGDPLGVFGIVRLHYPEPNKSEVAAL